MAPATAGAVLFRSRPSAASPLPDRAQAGQLNSAGELTITSQPADFLWCAVAGCHAITDPRRHIKPAAVLASVVGS